MIWYYNYRRNWASPLPVERGLSVIQTSDTGYLIGGYPHISWKI